MTHVIPMAANININAPMIENPLCDNIENDSLRDLLGNGGTPLLVSVLLENYAATKELIALGADKSIRSRGGKAEYSFESLMKISKNTLLKKL